MIGALLNNTVTLTPRTGRNKFNEASFGTAVTSRARFESVNKIVKGPQGEDIGCDAQVFLPSDVTPTVEDKLEFEGVTYRIVTIDRAVGRPGTTHHWECLLQRAA